MNVATSFRPETSYGVGSGSWSVFRRTGGALSPASKEILPVVVGSTSPIAMSRDSWGVTGNLSFELSAGSFDDWLAAALRSSWTTISISNSQLHASGSRVYHDTAQSVFSAVVPGQWVRMSGWVASANNGPWRVASKSADSSEITVSGSLTEESPGATVSITGDALVDGTTVSSFTLEEQFDTQVFHLTTGLVPNNLDVRFAEGEIVTCNVGVVGRQTTTAATASATPGAASTSSPWSVLDVASVYEGGQVSSLCLRSASFSFRNDIESYTVVGSPYASAVDAGHFSWFARTEYVNSDRALLDKHLADTETSIDIRVETSPAGAGAGYVFALPRAALTDARISPVGLDSDSLVSVGFESLSAAPGSGAVVTRWS